MSAPWLLRFVPRPQAAMRLYCFSYAGMGASCFRTWSAAVDSQVELCAVQLPGRENRFREPAIPSMAAIVDALVPALLPHMDRPFAFFGHSMGSVVAYEVARDLVRRGAPTPEHLFVSGRRPPSMVAPDPPMHVLPDREFVAEINRRYGGIPDAILRDPELMALFLPCLRADVTALETHQYQPSEPLHCPVSALGGAHDRLTPYEHLDAWRAETTAAFSVRAFPGDHFYLVQQRDSLLAHIAAALAPSLRPDNLMQNA